MRGKKIINIMIPVVLTAVIVFSLYKVITIRMEYQEAEDEYDSLMQYVVEDVPSDSGGGAEAVKDRAPVLEETGEEETDREADSNAAGAAANGQAADESGETEGNEAAESPRQTSGTEATTAQSKVFRIDAEALRAINSDYRAWLRIPVLGVSYPLVVGSDNDHYLHYTFEGRRNAAGCTFIDCETSADFTDKNTFIYGHNMRNGSMFGCLKRFRKEDGLCASDPYFYIYLGDMVYQYEIFAYYTTEFDSDRYMLLHTDEEYDYYVESARQLSEYTPGHTFDFSSRPGLVTLSTCSGQGGTTKRMVVHGVLIGSYAENSENMQ